MNANLVVISVIRLIQATLASVIFYKCYTLKVTSTIEVFCQKNSPPPIAYSVQYPFDYVHILSQTDCSSTPNPVTDSVSTGFAATSYLFTSCVSISIAYGLLAILFYALKHQSYELQKRMPALDLLASLLIGLFWAIVTFMGWKYFPEMKKATSTDSIQMKATVCRDPTAYCSSFNSGTWDDMNTYLFLAIANMLGWGISVWFIFMETGLCPDDEEDESEIDGIINGEYGNQGLPPQFLPFPSIKEGYEQSKEMYNSSGVDEDELMSYIKDGKNGGDRFANGYTFSPVVPSLSQAVDERQAEKQFVKAHNKWNVFKA